MLYSLQGDHHRPPLIRPNNVGFHLSIFCPSNVCMVSFTFTITTCKTCRESPKLLFEPNHLDMFKRKLNQLWLGGTIVRVPAGMSTFNKVTWFKAKNQLSLGVIRLESGRTKWSRIFHFLRFDDDFFWHCLHYLQWSYHQPVTVHPSNLRNSNLLHAKVSTLFKTIIFGIRAKFPRPNESYFGILGFTRQNAFHHVDMSKIFVEYGGKSQTCFRAGNTSELAERKTGRRGPVFVVHPRFGTSWVENYIWKVNNIQVNNKVLIYILGLWKIYIPTMGCFDFIDGSSEFSIFGGDFEANQPGKIFQGWFFSNRKTYTLWN